MASLQQVVEQLALLVAAGTNNTDGAQGPSMAPPPRGPIDFVMSTFKMLLSASALRDWAILLVIGSLFESARRMLASSWHSLINSFFVTAVFDDEDVSFQWIMMWLSSQPSWKGARNIQISTSNFDFHPSHTDEDWGDVNSCKVTYIPAVSESYTMWYQHRWMRITRAVESLRGGWSSRETLTMSIMTRDHSILEKILQDAKKEYFEAQKDKITIYVSERYNNDGWREITSRPKRPLNSIILDPGITELVLEDVRDFLDSKEWYAERGIPFRRGYLLYGAPGSGKTSLIHSIAGELGLNVYIISLSRSGLDDTGLAELISALPERCIALMEDIDAAFHHGLSRESPEPDPPKEQPDGQPTSPAAPTSNHVSLSGLLNALDGIAAQEGRVLFATTNKYSSLDPALCRPGRMDLHIEFKLASRFQAEALFKRFFAPSSKTPAAQKKDTDGGEDPRSKDLIELGDTRTPPGGPESEPTSPTMLLSEKTEVSTSGLAYTGMSHRARAPALSHDRIVALAAQFAHAIPERQLSMASLQGFLMAYKTRPFAAVEDVVGWVEKELAERRRLEGAGS